MDDKMVYWASVSLGVLALILLVSNIGFIISNRAMQAEYGARQTTINNGLSMSQLNQSIVQALAQAAIDNDDKDVRDLLSSQGITVSKK